MTPVILFVCLLLIGWRLYQRWRLPANFPPGPTRIGDYELPAGTTVFSFLWYILNDPAYWIDPRNFRPERFLDADGQFARDERLIPFLVGRRQCIGMALAQTELFLFFANLVREFRYAECPSSQLPEPPPQRQRRCSRQPRVDREMTPRFPYVLALVLSPKGGTRTRTNMPRTVLSSIP